MADDSDDDICLVDEYTTFDECVTYPKFSNLDLKSFYEEYMTPMIRILDVHNNASRLYLLVQLDKSNRDVYVTMSKLRCDKVNRPQHAEQLTNNLKDMMPAADPIYLDLLAELYGSNHDDLSEFLEKITTKNEYPKIQKYNDQVKVAKIINSLTINFKIKEFLRMCPDPEQYFNSIKFNSKDLHFHESMSYLKNRFRRTDFKTLWEICEFNLTKTFEALELNPTFVATTLTSEETQDFNYHNCFKITENLEFLKEMAYLEHKREIRSFLRNQQRIHQLKFLAAKTNGQLKLCECCYTDEILDCDACCCPAGHYFCSSCVKKGTEVSVGKNKLEIKCFADCDEELNLSKIKEFIDDKLYQRIVRLKQAQEVKAANIDGLEACAFCDYSVILLPDHKIINCLNPECKKETCRECRKESHFPHGCNQIEESADIKVRTMIENKMSEVLIRTCYYCKNKFVKTDGCNKITCHCGKEMCYICREPLVSSNSDNHFYTGNLDENKCPLFTEDNIVHVLAVEAAGKLVMKKLAMEQPELLKMINIDKILPEIKNKNTSASDVFSAFLPMDFNKLVAKLVGQNEEDIENLKEMRLNASEYKKIRK